MINLYNYYTDSTLLLGYEHQADYIPFLAIQLAKQLGDWKYRTQHPKGFKIITKSPYEAYCYAIEVLKGKFPEGEEAIAQDAELSYFYTTEILHHEFPEGEETIKTDPLLYNSYKKYIDNQARTSINHKPKGYGYDDYI
jgi:hypothetical protein